MLRRLRDLHGFEFPILLDRDAETIKDWGVFNDRDDRGRLIPHPTVVLFDAEGVIRYVFIETNYRLRPGVSELVGRLRELSDSR